MSVLARSKRSRPAADRPWRSTRSAALRWAPVPVGLLASAALVWGASYAAFNSTTQNPGDNWSAGTVAISDDDSNTAMFSASNLKPGSTGSKCVEVTSTGSLASTVKLYGTSASTTNALSSYLSLTVEEGSGGSFAGGCSGFTATGTSYTGTLSAFASGKTDFATGVGTWAPSGSASETRTYKLTYTLDPATPNSAQGGTAAIGFTWEAQNS
ncbi:TasA family protein [Flindersiella endophytica]